jgi:type VI secretion system protein VasD
MNLCRATFLFFLTALLLGCFGGKDQPPPPPPAAPLAVAPPPIPRTRVELRVEAAADVNPNAHGSGAPVVLRIYELKGLSSFNGADFFALYDKDQASLGGDLARKRELLLRPGEKQTLILEPEEGTAYFAALAAFRNLNSSRWRVSAPILPHQTNIYELKLGGTQMSVAAVAVPTSQAVGSIKTPLAPAAPIPPAAPSVSVPSVSVPSVSVPNVPAVTAPSVPSVSIPSATVPSVTFPSVSVTTAPVVTVPTIP